MALKVRVNRDGLTRIQQSYCVENFYSQIRVVWVTVGGNEQSELVSIM